MGRAYLGTRPSKGSVRSIGHKSRELTQSQYGLLPPEQVIARLNRALPGGARHFQLGQVSPACSAVDARGEAAAPVAVSEAQGEVGEIRALPEREAV